MSAAVAPLPPALPSTSRSRSRPPRGAVGLGPLPADLVTPTAVESNRTLIESLARSLSRPRQSSSSRPRSPTSTAGSSVLTREEWLASNGGQPWGALEMGARSPERRESAAFSSRGRTSTSTTTNDGSTRSESQQRTRREWSVSRREWVQAGSSSAASAFEVLIGTGSGEKSTSSSRSASPDRGRRAGVAAVVNDDQSTCASRSQSRARAVLDKVRRGLRSPRSSSHASLAPEEEADEVEPIVPKPAAVV